MKGIVSSLKHIKISKAGERVDIKPEVVKVLTRNGISLTLELLMRREIPRDREIEIIISIYKKGYTTDCVLQCIASWRSLISNRSQLYLFRNSTGLVCLQ